MFRMFGAKIWPRSEADWARYDRDRDQAVKEIMEARRHRGFGPFNLEDYLARAEGSKQPPVDQPVRENVLRGNKLQNKKADSEARAIGNVTLFHTLGASVLLRVGHPSRPRSDANLCYRATAIR